MREGATVGIPRALLYHWFAPAWETFLKGLGVEPIISPATNKFLLSLGLAAALDDVCLPVKLFLGHASYLMDSGCDYLFVPHLVSIERRAFTCPKFMGLPDLVRQTLPAARTLVARVDVRAGAPWGAAAREVAASLGCGGPAVSRAWRKALAAQNRYEQSLHAGEIPGVPVCRHGRPELAVLGHPYCLYDRFVNMNLLGRLTGFGCRLVTPEILTDEEIRQGLSALPKELFWSFGRRQLGAAHYLLEHGICQGLIHVTAFACGPEALVGDLIERVTAHSGLPMLRLHLDEHTGEAGLETRIEAFLDMITRAGRAG